MKKNFNVNIGGVIFHIDEDAYLLLSQYLNRLNKHFSRLEGSQDILNDIESRIAELFSEKCSGTKQVITLVDVNEVIAVMGQPVEIDREEGRETNADSSGNDKGDKRFFRNPDEKMIAGVCSGIAAWLHLDPVWIRLIFLVSLAAGGFGLLVYLVLWIVIPEAKTTSDKLEMRGAKINISNIEKSVREEITELQGKLGSMAVESMATIKRAGASSGSFFEVAGKGIVEVLTYVGRGLVILTGLVLALLGLGLIIALVAFAFGWTGGLYADNDVTMLTFPYFTRLLIGCNIPVGYLQIILMVVVGIPLFMMFYNGLRMIFRFDRIRHLGLTMFNIWVVGLFFLAWSGFKVFRLFQFKEEKKIEIALEKPASDTLQVKFFEDDPGMAYLGYEKYVIADNWRGIITDNKELYMIPHIMLEESSDSLFSVSQVTLARGKNRLEALQHLAGIRFQSAASGSALRISPFARLPKEECWRGEGVNILIRIPQGKFIRFDKRFRDLKPNWYYMADSEGELLFKMTGSGIEEFDPASDSLASKEIHAADSAR